MSTPRNEEDESDSSRSLEERVDEWMAKYPKTFEELA
jgi:hypothetical protein